MFKDKATVDVYGYVIYSWCTFYVWRCAKTYTYMRGLLRCSFNMYRQCESILAWNERQAGFPRFFVSGSDHFKKYMIKKTITTLSLVCLALGIHAESKYLTVEMKEGAKFSFLLADKPVITCQSGSLVVNKDAKTTYAFEGVKNYHFTENNEGSSGGTTKVEESYSQLL